MSTQEAAAPPAPAPPPPQPRRAGSLVGSGSGTKEGLFALGCGLLFGVANPIIGAPLDAIKSRMQASPEYATTNAFRTGSSIIRKEGFLALYRGLTPPLIGSTVFRSVQFTVYAAVYAATKDKEWLRTPIPWLADMERRVIFSGLVASTARSIIETPMEYVKVRRQVGAPLPTVKQALAAPGRFMLEAYKGLAITWLRTCGLMTSFFMMVDHMERYHHDVMAIPLLGPFIKGGVCATAAWVVVWPFENIKNQVQAGTPGVPDNANWLVRTRWVLANRGGILGLYRGIGPGLARSLLANGGSMIVYNFCQECARGME